MSKYLRATHIYLGPTPSIRGKEDLIPMRENAVLIECSFADAIKVITASDELPEEKRRHWITSLRQIAKALDVPLEVIPARYSAVRADLICLHEVPVGLTAKTLQNHKSNVKSALLWLAREKGIPQHGAPLTAEWAALRAKIKDALMRFRLSSFMRFCSANAIAPGEVNESVVDRFIDYRSRCSKPADTAFRRLMARAWNGSIGAIPGWPATLLVEPPIKSRGEIPWSAFPTRLQQEVEDLLRERTMPPSGLRRLRKNRHGQPIRPLKEVTTRTRRAELQGAARIAVKAGVLIEQLQSFSDLLGPTVVEKILGAYCEKNGGNPTLYTIALAGRFLAIAKETKCLSEADCDVLRGFWETLRADSPEGLTPKNMELIRKVLAPGVWDQVLKLPFAMMAEARRGAEGSIRAAVTAQLAVAIAILTVTPVRIKNLSEIRLGINLVKPGGPEDRYWLHFPKYDVKNRIKLEYPLEEHVTKLIDEYVHNFRHILLRGRNEDWLFPGMRGDAKGKITLSGQITERVLKLTGLRVTAHQFRHAAAAIILQKQPGNYELVRLLLGHRSVQTTIRCYIGLKEVQASQIFGELIRERLTIDLEAAE